MAELDAELLERVTRWCADAGRQAAAAQIRNALAPLSWDELLAVRALLADPPPARPLGPFALADVARGTPADLAADRERAGRYASAETASAAAAGEIPRPALPALPAGRGRAPIIHRVRDHRVGDAPPPAPPGEPARPLVDELLIPEGRNVLERVVRRAGASRPALLAALAGWRRPDGGTPGEEDLVRLLAHHGMTRAFERRERDGLLHALRAAGGVRAAAAARLGLEPATLDAAVARLGAGVEVERIREERRAELRRRATLSGRLRLLLADEARLRDLGLLEEVEADLRGRLPEHVRALSAAGGPLTPALARSLSLTSAEVRTVAERFGIEVAKQAPGSRLRPAGEKRRQVPSSRLRAPTEKRQQAPGSRLRAPAEKRQQAPGSRVRAPTEKRQQAPGSRGRAPGQKRGRRR